MTYLFFCFTGCSQNLISCMRAVMWVSEDPCNPSRPSSSLTPCKHHIVPPYHHLLLPPHARLECPTYWTWLTPHTLPCTTSSMIPSLNYPCCTSHLPHWQSLRSHHQGHFRVFFRVYSIFWLVSREYQVYKLQRYSNHPAWVPCYPFWQQITCKNVIQPSNLTPFFIVCRSLAE